jgi:BirA family biotin operon repressor/biotin-[acetyl-CoA-carboxylase] ligase
MDRNLEIVRLLADGELHSGEAIASRLGISRAAVWKAVRKTVELLDLDLESVRGHGYRLCAPLELLDAAEIRVGLPAPAQTEIRSIDVLPEVDSTNSWLMRRAHGGAPGGSVCLAERQTAGRGRRGRAWLSPFGANVYLSLLWRYPLAPAQLGGLSLAVGVAVARALTAAGASGIGLKWPNDLHWRRRKLAGLLLEVGGEAQGPSHVVVGVGLNLRLDPARAAAIDQPWTDLTAVLGAGGYRRNAVVVSLITELCAALERYGAEGLAAFLADWQRLDAYLGEPVELAAGERRIAGVHAGIDATGALLLEVDGKLEAFHAGEVSLRPQLR